jgi:hypothetical protein
LLSNVPDAAYPCAVVTIRGLIASSLLGALPKSALAITFAIQSSFGRSFSNPVAC